MSYTSGVLSLIKRLVKGSKLTKAEMDQNLTDIETAVADRYTKSEIDSALSGKSSTSHTHAWSEITSKPTQFNPSSHTHSIGEVGALSSTLTDMQNATNQRQQLNLYHLSDTSLAETPKLGDNVYFVDCTAGDVGFQLDSVASRRIVTVIKTDSTSNIITVDANTGRTIEGNSSEDITTQYGKLQLVFDGVDTWYKL